MIDPNEVVHTVVDEDGIQNITLANVAARRMKFTLVEFLRYLDPEGYVGYRARKRPHEGREPTPESRRNAILFAFAAVERFVLQHYIYTDDRGR